MITNGTPMYNIRPKLLTTAKAAEITPKVAAHILFRTQSHLYIWREKIMEFVVVASTLKFHQFITFSTWTSVQKALGQSFPYLSAEDL